MHTSTYKFGLKSGTVILSCALLIGLMPGVSISQNIKSKIQRLDQLVQNDNNSAAADRIRAGRDLIDSEKWGQALEQFDAVVTRYPNSQYTAAALYWKAYIHKRQRRYQEADRSLQLLLNRFPNSQWIQDAKTMTVELGPLVGRGDMVAEEARSAENDEVKIVALSSLYQANPERAKTYVIDILSPNSTSSLRVKEGAVKILAKYNDSATGEEATKLLMDLAQREQNTKLRKIIIHELGNGQWSENKFRFKGDESIVPMLTELALNTRDKVIANAAVSAINHIANHHEDARIKSSLIEIGKKSSVRQVREKAVSRLTKMAIEDGLDILPDMIVLYDANDNIEIKKHIISAISKMENPTAQQQVVTIARNPGSRELRERAIYVIGIRGSVQSVEALSAIYTDEINRELKDRILRAFSRTKHQAGLANLMEIAQKDSDIKMRMKAVNMLGNKKDPEAQKFLEQLLK